LTPTTFPLDFPTSAGTHYFKCSA